MCVVQECPREGPREQNKTNKKQENGKTGKREIRRTNSDGHHDDDGHDEDCGDDDDEEGHDDDGGGGDGFLFSRFLFSCFPATA